MQIDLMLCDYAQVSGDKLFVSGAGIDRMRVPAGSAEPFLATFALGGVLSLTPTEAMINHTVTFRVLHEDGSSPWIAGFGQTETRVVGGDLVLQAGEQVPTDDQLIAFAYTFQGVPFSALGRYVLVAQVDGTEVRRVGFTVEYA